MAEKVQEKQENGLERLKREEQALRNSPLIEQEETKRATSREVPLAPPPGPFVKPGLEIPDIMPPLPPAGHEQREEEKRRQDTIDERAAALFGDIEGVDPEKIKPDNEILGAIYELPNMLAVTEQQPGKRYKWVYVGQHGYFITQARLQGWVPVQGSDKEAEARTWTDTTRKLGDTVLMWIPEEKYRQLAQQDFQKRMLQQKSITAELEEMGERTGVRVSKGFRNRAMLDRLQEQAWARQVAEAKFKKLIEQGRIPGMEIG